MVFRNDSCEDLMSLRHTHTDKKTVKVVRVQKEIRDEFDEYLNVHLRDRDWRKALSGVRVDIYPTDVHGNHKEGYFIIAISLIGEIDPNHSRIEIFMEGNKIVNFPIFDFSKEAQDFKNRFSAPVVRDLLGMLNNFYSKKYGSNIGHFETSIREGIKSIRFFENFFRGFGVQADCITVFRKTFPSGQVVICFMVDLEKCNFWIKFNRAM